MTQWWLDDWFPVVGLFLQVTFWGECLALHGSPRLWAIMTGRQLPNDPSF